LLFTSNGNSFPEPYGEENTSLEIIDFEFL